MQVLQHLNIESVVVLGWSLGGHVGIEMIDLLKTPQTFKNSKKIKLKGLMITGTPPARGRDQIKAGFTMKNGKSELGLAGQKDWTDADALHFSRNSAAAGIEKCWEPWMYEVAKTTDPRARYVMAKFFLAGEGADQRRIVEEEDVLITVVNGAKEQFVNLDYLEGIRWKRLWREECVRLEGLHHAPFWEDPELFESVLVEFLNDVEKQ